MPTGTNIPTGQDWGAVNVGRAAIGGKLKKPTTARAIDLAKASGAIVTEKRHGAGGNSSAHSGGIMSAKKVRSDVSRSSFIVQIEQPEKNTTSGSMFCPLLT